MNYVPVVKETLPPPKFLVAYAQDQNEAMRHLGWFDFMFAASDECSDSK